MLRRSPRFKNQPKPKPPRRAIRKRARPAAPPKPRRRDFLKTCQLLMDPIPQNSIEHEVSSVYSTRQRHTLMRAIAQQCIEDAWYLASNYFWYGSSTLAKIAVLSGLKNKRRLREAITILLGSNNYHPDIPAYRLDNATSVKTAYLANKFHERYNFSDVGNKRRITTPITEKRLEQILPKLDECLTNECRSYLMAAYVICHPHVSRLINPVINGTYIFNEIDGYQSLRFRQNFNTFPQWENYIRCTLIAREVIPYNEDLDNLYKSMCTIINKKLRRLPNILGNLLLKDIIGVCANLSSRWPMSELENRLISRIHILPIGMDMRHVWNRTVPARYIYEYVEFESIKRNLFRGRGKKPQPRPAPAPILAEDLEARIREEEEPIVEAVDEEVEEEEEEEVEVEEEEQAEEEESDDDEDKENVAVRN